MCLVMQPGGEVLLVPSETLAHLMTHPGREGGGGREREVGEKRKMLLSDEFTCIMNKEKSSQ